MVVEITFTQHFCNWMLDFEMIVQIKINLGLAISNEREAITFSLYKFETELGCISLKSMWVNVAIFAYQMWPHSPKSISVRCAPGLPNN